MVAYCTFSGCNARTIPGETIDERTGKIARMHRFPSNVAMCKKWLELGGLKNTSVDSARKSKRVCSLHFEASCYNDPKNIATSQLKPTATPQRSYPSQDSGDHATEKSTVDTDASESEGAEVAEESTSKALERFLQSLDLKKVPNSEAAGSSGSPTAAPKRSERNRKGQPDYKLLAGLSSPSGSAPSVKSASSAKPSSSVKPSSRVRPASSVISVTKKPQESFEKKPSVDVGPDDSPSDEAQRIKALLNQSSATINKLKPEDFGRLMTFLTGFVQGRQSKKQSDETQREAEVKKKRPWRKIPIEHATPHVNPIYQALVPPRVQTPASLTAACQIRPISPLSAANQSAQTGVKRRAADMPTAVPVSKTPMLMQQRIASAVPLTSLLSNPLDIIGEEKFGRYIAGEINKIKSMKTKIVLKNEIQILITKAQLKDVDSLEGAPALPKVPLHRLSSSKTDPLPVHVPTVLRQYLSNKTGHADAAIAAGKAAGNAAAVAAMTSVSADAATALDQTNTTID